MSFKHLQYEIGPHEDIYINVLDTQKAAMEGENRISQASNEATCPGMYKYKGSLPILETFALRKGSNGNFSDKDARFIRIRKQEGW